MSPGARWVVKAREGDDVPYRYVDEDGYLDFRQTRARRFRTRRRAREVAVEFEDAKVVRLT